MKRLAIVMLAFAGSLAAQANYSGIWNGTGGVVSQKYTSVPVTAQMTLIQAGTALQGTFKAGNGKPVPLTGSVSGDKVVLSVANGAVTANLTAQTPSQLVGTMTSNGGQIANMVFVPQTTSNTKKR